MIPPYLERKPDPDGPINTAIYGVSEWHSLRDVAQEVAAVFGIVVCYRQEDEEPEEGE